MKKSEVIGIVVGIIALILIVGIFFKGVIQNRDFNIENKESSQKLESQSLGSLCSGEEECKNFCLNNRGQCEDYCRGNRNELCRIIFSSGDNYSEENKEKAKIANKKEDVPPIMKNLGVNIDTWNKQTNLAGDIIFTRKLLFDDGNVVNKWVFVEFGGTG